MEIKIREVNGEWAVDIETPDQIQSIYFKSRQNAFSFVKYLELADNVIELDKKELQATTTNYDRIKAMTVEEMADYFAYMFDCNLCPEQQRLSDNPLLEDERCDNNCMKHCKQWLEQEVSE